MRRPLLADIERVLIDRSVPVADSPLLRKWSPRAAKRSKGTGLSQPDVFDAALAARKEELSNVKIRAGLSTRPRAVLEADPEGKHFCFLNLHFSGYDRRKHDAGVCTYLPVNLGKIPDYYRRFIDPVDIVIIKTCPADAEGRFNFGPTNVWHRAIIERAKLVIVEMTRGLPYVYGERNSVHISEVDYIVTTTRADMMYVVTEYGMVNLKGKSVAERAMALISIAHPGSRPDVAPSVLE